MNKDGGLDTHSPLCVRTRLLSYARKYISVRVSKNYNDYFLTKMIDDFTFSILK